MGRPAACAAAVREFIAPREIFRATPAMYSPQPGEGRPFGIPIPIMFACYSLFAIHLACFLPFFNWVIWHGYRPQALIALAPLIVLWLPLCYADIRFRLQRPNRDQRDRFDDECIGWIGTFHLYIGLVFGGALVVIGLPAVALYGLWLLLHGLMA